MKIVTYKSRDIKDTWIYPEVKLGKLNLLVGDTATGKTRFLNTLFNLGRFAVTGNEFYHGKWDITFEQDDLVYRWSLETKEASEDESIIAQEELLRFEGDQSFTIIKRDEDKFIFNDQQLPKLPKSQTSVFLLKDEDAIHPIYEGFSAIMRRRFFADELEKAAGYQIVPTNLVTKIEKDKTTRTLFNLDVGLNLKLYFLSQYFTTVFKKVCDTYRMVFPFIRLTEIKDLKKIIKNTPFGGEIPTFCIRENNSDRWIPLHELSSGMIKILLLITDIAILPPNSIYLIDEYENSLGISAINKFTTILDEFETSCQIILTSHHPYIINSIPVSNWYVFHRKGNEISIKYGEYLTDRFGKSKQKAFIQLINDPFYVEGVE